MESKVFLITGVSSGLGNAFAQGALAAGHRVIGTLRSAEAASAFTAHPSGRALGVLLDITDQVAIPNAVVGAEKHLGPIDVLVNNAGYGLEGILEGTTLEEVRKQFDANVFGAVGMMKAVLPGMRARRTGRIEKIEAMREEIAAWEAVSRSTDFT